MMHGLAQPAGEHEQDVLAGDGDVAEEPVVIGHFEIQQDSFAAVPTHIPNMRIVMNKAKIISLQRQCAQFLMNMLPSLLDVRFITEVIKILPF